MKRPSHALKENHQWPCPSLPCLELLEAFHTGDGVDLIRESVRTVLQELVELEAAGVIGAGRYERTEHRITERNGPRPRLLTTKAGDVELRIPKLRKGSFFRASASRGAGSIRRCMRW